MQSKAADAARVGAAPAPLGTFYFCYFAAMGAWLPYWPLWLEANGFDPVGIGALVGLVTAVKIVGPNVWAWIADRRGSRMALVRFATVAATAAFSGVLLGVEFWWLALVLCVYSFFSTATLPQFEVVTLNQLGADTHRYTRIRLWGSLGFVVTVLAAGALVEAQGTAPVPVLTLALLAAIVAAGFVVRETRVPSVPAAQAPLLAVLRRPRVIALLGACLLMQASHGTYYAFFSIHLEEHGYSARMTGALWALGVVAEVVLYAFMHRLVPRFGLRALFIVAFALTTLRWILTGLLVDVLPVLLLAQTLHAASFGLYHGVAIQLIHLHFGAGQQGRGQALYSSLSFGAGGAIGSWLSGYGWAHLGAAETWLGAALASAVAWAIAWRWVR
ncbi:MAG: MFS transporter [Gammaproteobacteria bacterium]|nr:MFS transporter [Gammaproteobacteria bacterium]